MIDGVHLLLQVTNGISASIFSMMASWTAIKTMAQTVAVSVSMMT